jgi:histidyl-tRNA synthetase
MAKESKFTLRPEGTAGTIRAMVQNGLLNDALPQKVFYVLSCFRHERPQAGRLREFHQFGVEMAGSQSPYADAEVVSLAKSIIDRTGLKGIALNVNSIGCPTCRAEYHKALKSYFANRQDELCDTCKSRLEKNPMRILDCKSPICQDIAKDAPVILDYLCEDCSTHFEKFKSILTSMGIEYSVNPKIVRGLDYYTKTVFEFVTTDIGAQGTVCGGGRYDGLIEQLSGKHVPALGFGMGLERLILTMESQGCDFMESPTCDLYIATMGETAKDKAVQLVSLLREEGYLVEYDLMDRGIKAQMKYANKLKSKFVVVLGDNEIESQTAKLKDMASGEETPITLGEKFLESFSSVYMANMMSFED